MDTANHFKVRSPDGGRTIYFDTNNASPILVKLTPAEALNLAAWLVAMTTDPVFDDTYPVFDRMVNQIVAWRRE